ncbi:MAG: hypothetical protein WEB30_11075 [Cyclobacteriaceae bacterium]
MRKFYSVPLLFLLLAAGIGLFLRWQFIEPTPGIRYTFFLHAHSHVMFLGWAFNVLYLAFTENYLSHKDQRRFKLFFLLLQTLVMAMMISFPIQGYGLYSIIFSTLHTIGVIIYISVFVRFTQGQRAVSLWFARASLFFFLLSTAGPFSLGYLTANDLVGTVWYNFSIYYYLHFQYNGFFIFGILSLFYQLLEKKQVAFDAQYALIFGKWMAIACVPAYFLSTLFARPGLIFNFIGAFAGVIQLVAVMLFYDKMKVTAPSLKLSFHPGSYTALKLLFAGFILKSVLQLLSAHSEIAVLAYETRPLVIAYLHLVLLGVITFFLFVWYVEMEFVDDRLAGTSIKLVFAGFAGSEICLVIMPWWTSLVDNNFPSSAVVIFFFSTLLLIGAGVFYIAFLAKKDDKNQFSF